MKKERLILLLTSSLILVSCGAGNDASFSEKQSSYSYDESHSITLKMFGDLYPNQMRSIYALLGEDIKGEKVVWASSNEEVISVSEVDNLNMPEALLTNRSLGEATITASLESDPHNSVSMDFKIEAGEAMSEELYTTITSSVKFVFDDQLINYDENYAPTVNNHYQFTSIFEEIRDNSSVVRDNYTDGYQTIEVDLDNPSKEAIVNKVVRDYSNDAAKEYINIHNEIDYEPLTNEEGETVDFDSTYFFNQFANTTYMDNTSFCTFDGGNTYHYVGGYMGGSVLGASLLFLSNFSPDDIYFVVKNGTLTNLNMVVDPAIDSSSPSESIKYGRLINGEISEIGTAKIEHISPFEHLDYHDALNSALTNMAALKNYTASYVLENKSDMSQTEYIYRFSEDTIDVKITDLETNTVLSHTGAHKLTETSYEEYSYDESSKQLVQTEVHPNAVWEGINDSGVSIVRYPTFDFAGEIFLQNDDGSYYSRADGEFIRYIVYLPKSLSYSSTSFTSGTLSIKDNYLSSASGEYVTFSEEECTFAASFSNFDSTDFSDLDFTNIKKKETPSSWQEDNETLYKEFAKWNITEEMLPYLYCLVGYSDYFAYTEGLISEYGNHAFLETNSFPTSEERDEFVSKYEALLLEKGFSKTDSRDANNSDAYLYLSSDGKTKLSISKKLNWWNGTDTLGAKIFIYNTSINCGGE